jgi:hypothetical protein
MGVMGCPLIVVRVDGLRRMSGRRDNACDNATTCDRWPAVYVGKPIEGVG